MHIQAKLSSEFSVVVEYIYSGDTSEVRLGQENLVIKSIRSYLISLETECRERTMNSPALIF